MVGSSIVSEILPVEINNGNDGRGTRWFSSAKLRKKYESVLRNNGLERKQFGFPVKIRLTRILGKGQRLWDNDSIGRGSAKELIDALKAVGWWHDDSPKWITQVDYRQDASQRSTGPSVLLEVFESESF